MSRARSLPGCVLVCHDRFRLEPIGPRTSIAEVVPKNGAFVSLSFCAFISLYVCFGKKEHMAMFWCDNIIHPIISENISNKNRMTVGQCIIGPAC